MKFKEEVTYSKLENGEFAKALNNIKVPLLVLDEKWHHLLAGMKKTKEIKEWEQKVGDLLKLQGKLNQDLKDLKKVKNSLMDNIVDNMDEDSASDKKLREKKLEESRRLIDEANEKIAEVEDALLDLPRDLDEANKTLMIYSMDLCYRKLRDNAREIEDIGNWIKKMKVQLKKNILIKQADESKNQEIYAYMHDVLGANVIDVFDLKYDEDGQVLSEDE